MPDEQEQIEPLHISQAFGISPDADLDFFDANLYFDSRLFIDPFLLKRSPVEEERELFTKFGDFFKEAARKAISTGPSGLRNLSSFLSFKEPKELYLGYTLDSNDGKGLATRFSSVLITFFLQDTARRVVNNDHLYPDRKFNPAILPLLSEGLGPDGISDLAGNLFMDYLIKFTQKQCEKFNIPLQTLPVGNSFDFTEMEWTGGFYAQLPENPIKRGSPIVFIPWHLLRGDDGLCSGKAKANILGILRNDPELSDRFSSLLLKKADEISTEEIREVIKQENSLITDYLGMMERERAAPYDFKDDPFHFLAFKKYKTFFEQRPHLCAPRIINNPQDLLELTLQFISVFQQEFCVRNGWKDCWRKDKNGKLIPVNEVPTGRRFRGMGFAFFCHYKDTVTFLPEVGSGNGFMDFFIVSNGTRIIIELKNLHNAQPTGEDSIPAYLHGIQRQLPNYVRSVGVPVKFAFYLTFQHFKNKNTDHSGRAIEIENERDVIEKMLQAECGLEELRYINFDVSPKPSASDT